MANKKVVKKTTTKNKTNKETKKVEVKKETKKVVEKKVEKKETKETKKDRGILFAIIGIVAVIAAAVVCFVIPASDINDYEGQMYIKLTEEEQFYLRAKQDGVSPSDSEAMWNYSESQKDAFLAEAQKNGMTPEAAEDAWRKARNFVLEKLNEPHAKEIGLVILQIFHIRYLRQVEVFCNLRSNLGCITINSLTSCDNQVIFHSSQSTGNGTRCSQSICTAQLTVSQQNGSVYTHCQSLSQDGFCLWQTHCYYCNMGIIFVFQLKGKLQSSLVVRVHNARYSLTDKGAGLGINLHFGSVRHLFYANYYFHYLF